MEDVIQTYLLPYDPAYPVVCFDEACKQLFGEVRSPRRSRRGRAQVDYEYERKGVCHQLLMCEPLRGWRPHCWKITSPVGLRFSWTARRKVPRRFLKAVKEHSRRFAHALMPSRERIACGIRSLSAPVKEATMSSPKRSWWQSQRPSVPIACF
jgi:hypothetical protein